MKKLHVFDFSGADPDVLLMAFIAANIPGLDFAIKDCIEILRCIREGDQDGLHRVGHKVAGTANYRPGIDPQPQLRYLVGVGTKFIDQAPFYAETVDNQLTIGFFIASDCSVQILPLDSGAMNFRAEIRRWE